MLELYTDTSVSLSLRIKVKHNNQAAVYFTIIKMLSIIMFLKSTAIPEHPHAYKSIASNVHIAHFKHN